MMKGRVVGNGEIDSLGGPIEQPGLTIGPARPSLQMGRGQRTRAALRQSTLDNLRCQSYNNGILCAIVDADVSEDPASAVAGSAEGCVSPD